MRFCEDIDGAAWAVVGGPTGRRSGYVQASYVPLICARYGGCWTAQMFGLRVKNPFVCLFSVRAMTNQPGQTFVADTGRPAVDALIRVLWTVVYHYRNVCS